MSAMTDAQTRLTELVRLAREAAFNHHAHFCMLADTEAHVQGMNDREWGFSACPHPDCAMFRADALAALLAVPQETPKHACGNCGLEWTLPDQLDCPCCSLAAFREPQEPK